MEIVIFALLIRLGSTSVATLLNVPNCGLSDATGRIIGGRAASIQQAPWFAQLTFDGYFCGGAFITPRHILTAAHCGTHGNLISNPRVFLNLLQVKTGSSRPNQMHVYDPAAFVRHPRFNGQYFLNDIMIIDMGREINAPGLRPICLPGQTDHHQTWEGTMAAIFGLGKVSLHLRKNAARLMVTLQKILPNDKCVAHPKLKKLKYDSRQHMCAYLPVTKRGRTDACEGDSGGPLTIVRNLNDSSTRQFAVGLVSYGFSCAAPNTPGVYTRISNYYSFIEKTLWLTGGSKYLRQ